MDITLNGITLSTSKNPNSVINFTGKKIFDEVRGYLVYLNSNWIFIGFAQIKQFGDIAIKKLALVLESPHKDEFDQYSNPLRPANGKTGYRINNKITSRNAIVNILDVKFAYEVYLMNSIQYQASCYCVLGNLYSRDNTNQIFRKLFSKNGFDLREDFIFRLKAYAPDIVINSCTSSGGLKKTVEVAIKEAGYKSVGDCHPSAWR